MLCNTNGTCIVKFKNKVVSTVLAAGALTIGATLGATPANAYTSYP